MEIKIKKSREYIPEWNANKKDKEPIKVVLRYLTTSEKDDTMIIRPPGLNSEPTVDYDRKLIFKLTVQSIENLTVDVEGKKIKITTSQGLLDTPQLDDLYAELFHESITMYRDLVTKKK